MASAAPLTVHAPDAVHAASSTGTPHLAPRTSHSSLIGAVHRRARRPEVGALFRLWIAIVAIGGVFLGARVDSRHGLRTDGAPSRPRRRVLLRALLHAVTATSVGYGDIVPIGLARVLAIARAPRPHHLGCVISKFVSAARSS